MRSAITLSAPTLILYDGVCALCNGLVRFLLRRDPHDQFRFAPLQSPTGQSILSGHNLDPTDLNTVCVIAGYGSPHETFLIKSDAVLYAVAQLGGFWRIAELVRLVPRALRDAAYDLVARTRYRVFGKYDTCPLPSPQHRAKFIDL
jgi:predicted DCC family thiol-disulfide oxidoreductase YuxK